MNKTGWKSVLMGLLVVASWTLAGCAAYGPSDPSAYDLSRYDKVMIDPVTVSFAPGSVNTETGSHLPPSEEQMRRMKRGVAELFDAAFRKELSSNSRVTLVDQPGPGVLRITPELLDVRLHSPLLSSVNPSDIYVRTIGEVTLDAAFRDSESQQALIRLHDTVRGEDLGLMRLASPVFTRAELKRIFRDWAQVVREDILRAR